MNDPLAKTRFDLDPRGVRYALNVFIGATIVWLLVRVTDSQPIWAISSMIAASDPRVEEARKFFRGRFLNSVLGGVTGLFILFVGGTSQWKIPIALSCSVLLSTYVAKVPVMWRQAPITATIVVASGLSEGSKVHGLRLGFERIADVLLGCGVGLLVTFCISRMWPLAECEDKP